jgi:hypothetical protein
MRNLTVVGLVAVFGTLPAVAQTSCRIANMADGQQSFVSGNVTGTSLSMLVTENGPFSGTLTLDDGSAYKAAAGSPALKVFRAGHSLEGKDWMAPGTVETVDGGLLMTWPAFSLRGAPVSNITVELSSGMTKTRQTISALAGQTGPTAIFLRLDGRLATPGNAHLIETDYQVLNNWRRDVSSRSTLKVDVFDADAGVHIAALAFRIPEDERTQARLISDVTALRRAVADKTCS